MSHGYPEIRQRLRRAAGHLEKTISMLDEKRDCPDIAQQLHAVEKALHNAKTLLIQDYIDHCLEDAVHGKGADHKNMINDFKSITKYL